MTPQILDILKQKHAPATFFVIGSNANRFPDCSSANTTKATRSAITPTRIRTWTKFRARRSKLELNLTERLFDSTLGVKTLLFRPPYGIDHQPETADEVAHAAHAAIHGLSAGGRAHRSARLGRERRRAAGAGRRDRAARARAGQQGVGNIVLLHDGGGDRSHTVAGAAATSLMGCAPRAIDIVPVSDLIGQTRAQVMLPLISGRERWAARADALIF